MAPSGVDLIFVPSFVDVKIDEENKTAMRMKVQTRLPFKSERDEREEKIEASGDESEGSDNVQKEEEQPSPEEREEGEQEDILDI
jgi:hypothetical protein